jgi:parallel beta-helix repeat protein
MAGSRIRGGLCVVLAVAGAAAWAPPAAAKKRKLPVRNVQCGDTITESLRVANNLRDCGGNGLVVGAPDITIDLGGHRIDGGGSLGSAGIDNRAGHAGVTIRNGTVAGFEHDVALENASGNTLTDLYVLGATSGIQLVSSSNNTIADNTASGNLESGIELFASDANTLTGNDASGNDIDGFYVEASSKDLFLRNRAVSNGSYGLEIFGLDAGTLKGNLAAGNGIDGIILDNGSTDNLLKGNTASGNDQAGIEVAGGSGNTLTGNSAHENGAHGILSNTNALTLLKNRADRNGFLNGGAGNDAGLGLSIPAGATSKGNKASGNDDPAECQSAELECHVP